MKAKEIRDFSAEELQQKLQETEQELMKLRLQHSSGQLEKPDQLRRLRRDIARIRTVMNETKAE